MKHDEIIQTLSPDLDPCEKPLIIFSTEAGKEKPDPKFFRLALSKAKAGAGECLSCTEDLLHTLATQRAGMMAARIMSSPNSDIAALSETLKSGNDFLKTVVIPLTRNMNNFSNPE